MVISLMMGIQDLTTLAVFMYQKEILKIEPSAMQFIQGILIIPWCIKPVFGNIVDRLVFRIRRTKYIIYTTSLVRMLCLAVAANFPLGALPFYLLVFVVSLCTLFENIVSEYILVVSTKKENEQNPGRQANHLPIYFGFRSLGSLVGSFFGGRLIKSYRITTPFAIGFFFPLVTIFVALLYKEEGSGAGSKRRSWSEEWSIMKSLMMRDKVFQMIVFVGLINMTPSFDVAFTFFMTDYLKFTTEDLADFSTASTICYIIGLYVYANFLMEIHPKRFFVVTNFILWLINVSFLLVILDVVSKLGMNNWFFCILNYGSYSFISEINYMPIMTIWCSVCPKNLEATSITLFTGIMNLTSNLSNYTGALIIWLSQIRKEEFGRTWILGVIQNAYMLLIFVMVICVRFPNPNEKAENQKDLNPNPEEEKKVD